MRWQIAIGALLFVDGIERILPCRRSALSGLAVHPGQGAGNLARRGVGRSAARRHQGQMEERCQGECAGAETRRQADFSRGRPEGDHRISRKLGRRQGHGRQTPVRRPVRYPQCAAFVGPERARTNYPQAARRRRKDPGRCTLRCRRCSLHPRPTRPKSKSSAINWSGKPGFLRIGSGWSNSSVRCRPRLTSGCSRSVA